MKRTKIPAKAITVWYPWEGYYTLFRQNDTLLRFKNQPVVYFLSKGERVIYIGATKRLEQRIMTHYWNKVPFDNFSFYPTNTAGNDHFKRESRMIRAFRPKFNKRKKEGSK